MCTVKNVPGFVPVFLYAVTMLIFQIKRIIRIIQVKNGLTMSFLFFGKCQKFGVDRMVLNGEKKEDGLSLPSNSSLVIFTILFQVKVKC